MFEKKCFADPGEMNVLATDRVALLKELLHREGMCWSCGIVDSSLPCFYQADAPFSQISRINELHRLIFAICNQHFPSLRETMGPVREATGGIRGTHE